MSENTKPENDTADEFEPVTDDIDTDESELADEEEYTAAQIQKLKQRLKACESEKMRHLEELQRTKAEFLNSKKRREEQFEREKSRVTESVVVDILPLADSFLGAMQHERWNECDETWRKGIEGIYGQLQQLLTRYGVKEITDVGTSFDPERHEAVANEPVDDSTRVQTVTSVIQTGYEMNGTVLRPAKVTVGVEA